MKLPASEKLDKRNEIIFGGVKFAFETKAKLCKQEEARLRVNPTVELIRKLYAGHYQIKYEFRRISIEAPVLNLNSITI